MPPTEDATGDTTVHCSGCGSEIKKRAEICPECGTRQRSPPDASDDRSILGAVLSVPVPGLGQIVNRQYGRGLLFMMAFYGGFFVFNTILGVAGVLDLLLFGIWGYAIYDAYVMGWQSDGQEPATADAVSGGTADVEGTETTSPSGTKTTGTSGTTTNDLAGGEPEGSDTTAKSVTADAATGSTASEAASTADGASVGNSTEENGTADGTAATGGGDDMTADSATMDDDIDDGEEAAASIEDPDNEEENDGSKWSRNGSGRSWGSD